MSNKRNRRRYGQRIRAEVRRKPVKRTKSSEAFIASQPAARARKVEDKRWSAFRAPTRKQRKAHSRVLLKMKPYRWRGKPRTNLGAAFWRHSHDV